jgi:hypothetical protein
LRRGPGHSGPRALDSNGPDIKIRGTASQIFEKYLALARDAQASGDRVMAENYLQHAEHYYRILNPGTADQGRQQPSSKPAVRSSEPGDEGSSPAGNGHDIASEAQA